MSYELTKSEKEAINDSDLEFFEETNFSREKKEKFLYCAVATDRLEVIKYFMEQGIKITNGECICSLFGKKTKQATIDYLESMNVDFNHRGGMALLYAAKANNVRGVKFMSKNFTETDMQEIINTLNVVFVEHKEKIEKCEEVLNILLPKLSFNRLTIFLDKFSTQGLKNYDTNKKYILNQYLSLSLKDENKSTTRLKI